MTTTARTTTAIARDALDQLAVCKETLRQLEALCWSIKTEQRSSSQSKLAAVGAYLSLDIGDLVDRSASEWTAELDALEEAGGDK